VFSDKSKPVATRGRRGTGPQRRGRPVRRRKYLKHQTPIFGMMIGVYGVFRYSRRSNPKKRLEKQEPDSRNGTTAQRKANLCFGLKRSVVVALRENSIMGPIILLAISRFQFQKGEEK